MEVLVILGVPLGAVLLSGLVLAFFSTPWLVRISKVAIAVPSGLTLSALLLLATLPRRQNSGGGPDDTCPDFDTVQGVVLGVVAFTSIAVGAVALASSLLSVARRVPEPGRGLTAIAAVALTLTIWIPLVIAAFCGFN
jgi:hypothetical protein